MKLRSLVRFFLLALVTISIFSTNLVFATDFVEELTNKSLMMFTGPVSKEVKKHSLVEFKGDAKGRYLVFGQDSAYYYKIEGSSIKIFSGGKLITTYQIEKQCNNNSCIFFLRRSSSGNPYFSLVLSPPGYKALNEARIFRKKGSTESFVNSLRESFDEASSKISTTNADIIVYKVANSFLGLGYFKEAKDCFLLLNEAGGIAVCDIMLIASGELVDNINIEKTAKLAFDSLISLDFTKKSDMVQYYATMQAIAYSCAKMGNFTLAQEYAHFVLQSAERSSINIGGLAAVVSVDINQLKNEFSLYSQNQMPAVYKASSTE